MANVKTEQGRELLQALDTGAKSPGREVVAHP